MLFYSICLKLVKVNSAHIAPVNLLHTFLLHDHRFNNVQKGYHPRKKTFFFLSRFEKLKEKELLKALCILLCLSLFYSFSIKLCWKTFTILMTLENISQLENNGFEL